MKIIYIANARIPTEKAHGYQICKMCEEFKRAGSEVELWLPNIKNTIKDDPFNYYKLTDRFLIRRLFVVNLLFLEKFVKTGIWFVLQSWIFYWRVFFCRFPKDAVIYTRNNELAWLLSLRKKRVAVEIHDLSQRRLAVQIKQLKKAYKIITITKGLKDRLIKKGIGEEVIMVSPDAVDLAKFDISLSEDEAREKTELPKDKRLILYVGHLYDWKGAHTLAEAAKELSDDYRVVFVGGTDQDIETFKKEYAHVPTIMIMGRVEHEEVPVWLRAADILVLPNSGRTDISRYYTSPLKLFEYMAAGRPIIASDLPSIREILNEDNCLFFQADKAADLAGGIKGLLADKDRANRLAEEAFNDAQKYTWNKRAEGVVNFIKNNEN